MDPTYKKPRYSTTQVKNFLVDLHEVLQERIQKATAHVFDLADQYITEKEEEYAKSKLPKQDDANAETESH